LLKHEKYRTRDQYQGNNDDHSSRAQASKIVIPRDAIVKRAAAEIAERDKPIRPHGGGSGRTGGGRRGEGIVDAAPPGAVGQRIVHGGAGREVVQLAGTRGGAGRKKRARRKEVKNK
jgi:hypothetical protein